MPATLSEYCCVEGPPERVELMGNKKMQPLEETIMTGQLATALGGQHPAPPGTVLSRA